jgi:hypothetical protein
MGSRDGLMNGLHSIAGALLGQGDVAGAARHFREALTIALQVNAEAEVMNLMVLGARLLIAQGRASEGAQMLHSILKHPATASYTAHAAKALERELNAASTDAPWTQQQMIDVMLAKPAPHA